MLEYDVITIKDHDEIQKAKGRRKKVAKFMECVFGKEKTDWIPSFLYVLELKQNINLAKQLTSGTVFPPVQDIIIPKEETVRVTACLRALPTNTERRLLENDGGFIDEAVKSLYASPILNLREGSIYFLINISKDTSFVLQQNPNETLATLVKTMLQSDKVKDSITEKTYIMVDIDETDENAFLNETFDEERVLVNVGPKYGKECSRCIQKTIKDSYASVLDEIETDIIAKTLKNDVNVPDFIQHKCIDSIGSIPRTERVDIFLQYALTHEHTLQTLMHLLNDQEIYMERKRCSECNGLPVKRSSADKSKKRTVKFQIEKDRFGEIIVELSKDTVHEGNVLHHETGAPDLEVKESAQKEMTIVAAIEIGTSYSGYGYSTVKAYQAYRLDITCNQSCNSGGKQLISSKVPSCILMTKDLEFVSFGYEAEKEYESIIAEEIDENYYFIDKFKMALHENQLFPEDLKIEDVRGHAVAAVDVFATAITALKNDVEQHMTDAFEIPAAKVKWVLTVPSLGFSVKEFMRKSAEKAGIRSDQLSIEMELDAASTFYLHQSYAEESKTEKFLIIDIGGGTFDVCVYERTEDNQLRELCSPSCGLYGGTTVNRNFIEILRVIVGTDVMESLKKNHTGSYLELLREFDWAKRVRLTNNKRKTINFTFPLTIFNQLCSYFCNLNFKQMVERSVYNQNISIVGDKLRITKETMYTFFLSATNQIIEEIERVLRTVDDSEVTKILLVGGFAESEILQVRIRKTFPLKDVILFDESDLFVLKGAVLLGHQSNIIKKIT